MANYHGILQGGTGSFSIIKLGDAGAGASAGTAFITSSAGGVDIANINKLTASYAKITELDVVTLNSVTTTQENLNVSASLIVASDGAAGADEADGSGLYISGAAASLTWDNSNSRLAVNKSFYGSAAAEFGGNVTAVGSFIIGSADLNEADMEKLDGITNGTVAANKAVVVDANKDASGFRNVTGTGAITAGTSFIIGSADLNEADMEKIDGITNGTVAASKAVVVDSNKDASGFRNVTLAGLSGSSTLQVVGSITSAGALNVSGNAVFDNNSLQVRQDADNYMQITADAIRPVGSSLSLKDDGGQTRISIPDGGNVAINKDDGMSAIASFGDDSVTLGGDSADTLTFRGTVTGSQFSVAGATGNANFDGSILGGSTITAGSSFVIGSADLNEADMEKLDGITNGTVAASKAVVVDANLDASGFRNVTGTGAITAGTSFIIGSADLNEADMEKIDGITNGAGAANKALVLDGNADVASGLRSVTGSGDLKFANAHLSGDLYVADDVTADAATFGGLVTANAGAKGTFFSGSSTLQAVGATTLGSTLALSGAATFGSYISASSYVSASSFSLGENSATIEYSDALDLSLGSTKYAALSTDYFSASVELQGPTVHTSGSVTAGTSFIIGSADLNEADLEKLDGITNGTVAASKAVVVDANKDIGSFRNVTLAKLSGSSTLQAVGATTLGSTLSVSGAATIEGAVSGAAGTFDALAGTSLALQSGGITAAGAIAGASTITSTGLVSGSGGLIGMGATTLGSTLNVSGTATMNAIKATTLSGSSTLQTVGSAILGSTLNVSGAATFASTGQFGGHVTPATDSTYNLGSTAKRWANIYTGDLHLKNERGNWTIFEEADHLRVRNNLTGKMYKMGLTPISED